MITAAGMARVKGNGDGNGTDNGNGNSNGNDNGNSGGNDNRSGNGNGNRNSKYNGNGNGHGDGNGSYNGTGNGDGNGTNLADKRWRRSGMIKRRGGEDGESKAGECTHVMHGRSHMTCLLYTSPSPRDGLLSRMPSSA